VILAAELNLLEGGGLQGVAVRGARDTRRHLVALGAFVASLAAGTTPLKAADTNSPLVFVDTDTVNIEGSAEANFGVQGSSGSWFNLLQRLVPSYNPNRTWAEGWFAPGIDITLYPRKDVEVYGALSVGISGTWGSDLYNQTNQGAVLLENAYAGIRTTNPKTSWNIDLSSGQRDYKVGTGMLIGEGADNGFERGADYLAPRTAWLNATVGRYSYNGTSVDAFYLVPNPVQLFDTDTTLTGGVIQHNWGTGNFVGVSYIRVLTSTQAYPVAASPFIIPNGRDGLEAIQGFARVDGTAIGLPNAWVHGEFALERNSRIDMRASAFYGEVGYRFATLPLRPALSYDYATFSGDDPNSPQYGRFDSLYSGNDQSSWSFGIIGSNLFRNSNTNFNRITLDLTASKQDALKFEYVHTRLNELATPTLGPLAGSGSGLFNGALSIPALTNPNLADEIDGQWIHQFRPNVVGNLTVGVAMPGAGLTSLPNAQAKTWYGVSTSLRVTTPGYDDP
jgi:hypothetical protein